MSRPHTRRKCRCCTKLFSPDPRTQDRQRYCSQRPCQQASKAASQRRWLSKDGNGDLFRGEHEVSRVQIWRKSHPGYWKRKNPSSQGTQAVDGQLANINQSSRNVPRGLPSTLQDDCLSQNPAFVGLISMFTGSTLQEDIAVTTRQLLLRGRNILGCVIPEPTQTTLMPIYHVHQTPAAPATAAPHSGQFQLGGPPSGPP
jgi:hypothetical protein